MELHKGDKLDLSNRPELVTICLPINRENKDKEGGINNEFCTSKGITEG